MIQVSNIGIGEFIEKGNFRYITKDTFIKLRCTEIVPGDILISRMPKPTGRAWLVTEMPWRMITAVDVAIAKVNKNRINSLFLVHHLNSTSNIDIVEKHQTGTTRPRISRKNLGSLNMLLPPILLQNIFQKFSSKSYKMITNLRKKNENLSQTRDLLLPKLISGEIDVEDIDIKFQNE